MPVSIRGTAGGSVTLSSGAAAADTTLTLPNTTGTVALTASPTFSGTLTATTITSPASTALTFQYGGTTGATLDTSGNLLVGTTSPNVNSGRHGISVLAPTGGYVAASFANDGGSSAQTGEFWNKATSGNNAFITFSTEATATERGTISYQRSSGLVVYGTTSDYRAKIIFGPVEDSGAAIDALKVYRGKMKGATVERPMFIAHEAQETAPYAVIGEKDAVNDEGTPVFQQMDVSSFVPLLVAEIQSLRARLAALEAK